MGRVLRAILVSVWVNFVIWVVVGIVFGFCEGGCVRIGIWDLI